ncbi:MAG TPA: preprotein translocase subunit TatC, partial [Chloroflexi bacterium]|nr:preprotein translocase subunit TatC [Chloroflexota bacterium]
MRQDDPSTMGLLEHLEELRQRLIWAIIAITMGTLIGVFLTQPVLRALTAPLGDRLPFASSPTTPPAVFIKVAILIGLVLAMPVIMYQLFQFLAPGLKPNERRYILIGAPTAALSFALGVIFAATVLLPAAIPFLQGFLPGIVEQRYCIHEYISF